MECVGVTPIPDGDECRPCETNAECSETDSDLPVCFTNSEVAEKLGSCVKTCIEVDYEKPILHSGGCGECRNSEDCAFAYPERPVYFDGLCKTKEEVVLPASAIAGIFVSSLLLVCIIIAVVTHVAARRKDRSKSLKRISISKLQQDYAATI